MRTVGKVYLVGAGPGATGLMTLRARQVMADADVVVYDRLVHPRLLNFAPPTARFVYVGKQSGRHPVPQDEIQKCLIRFAEQGNCVVRLKGGDPFVFGRGGEEAMDLANHQIPFEIVPGITSAIAVPAYAGIPVTHRESASMFTVVTGHGAFSDIHLKAPQLETQQGTIIVLMGMNHLGRIMDDLLASGLGGHTPVALVRQGTWGDQQVVTGTVSTIVEIAKNEKFAPPAVIVIGETVDLRESISWFETLPLFGQKILVIADTINKARKEADRLEALGAEVFDFALERHVCHLPGVFDEFFAALFSGNRTFVEFRTVLGVFAFARAIREGKIDFRQLARTKFVANHVSVAGAISEIGFTADYTGREFTLLPENEFHAHSFILREAPNLDLQAQNSITPDKILSATVCSKRFYQMQAESGPVESLVRTWGALFRVKKSILSEVAYQYFEQVVLPLATDAVHAAKVDVAK